MFKIFEQAGVEYKSPYTDANLPGMQISNLQTSIQGAIGTAVNRIKEKVFRFQEKQSASQISFGRKHI